MGDYARRDLRGRAGRNRLRQHRSSLHYCGVYIPGVAACVAITASMTAAAGSDGSLLSGPLSSALQCGRPNGVKGSAGVSDATIADAHTSLGESESGKNLHRRTCPPNAPRGIVAHPSHFRQIGSHRDPPTNAPPSAAKRGGGGVDAPEMRFWGEEREEGFFDVQQDNPAIVTCP